MFKFNKLTLNNYDLFWSPIKKPYMCFFKLKVAILGKVFRWFFKERRLLLNLNHGHKNIFFFKKRNVKVVLGKYSNKLLFLHPMDFRRLFFFLKKPRATNPFTGRGLHTNSVFSRKRGKISTYV